MSQIVKLKKNKLGKVDAIMKAGSDFVKQELPYSVAYSMIMENIENVSISNEVEGYQITLNNKWFFQGEIKKATSTKK